jgi:hypothetical protein
MVAKYKPTFYMCGTNHYVQVTNQSITTLIPAMPQRDLHTNSMQKKIPRYVEYKFNFISANSNLFWSVNQGPSWNCLMKKTKVENLVKLSLYEIRKANTIITRIVHTIVCMNFLQGEICYIGVQSNNLGGNLF